jgi:excisionase family DNA binding protein
MTHKMDSERLTCTAGETSKLLGLSRNSVYQGVMVGEIPHVRLGKRVLIPQRALQAMLESADQRSPNQG